MKRYQKDLIAIVTMLMGINTPMAMETTETTEPANHFKGISKATQTLATSVFGATPEVNTLSCAVGPVQVLSTLHQALGNNEKDKKKEIEDFVGHALTAEGLKNFKSLVPNEITHNCTFLNNQYILPADGGVNQDAVEALSQLGSSIVPQDFSNPEGAAFSINKIVAEDTKGMIKDLAQPSHFNHLTKVVLLSNLYVKAKWDAKFHDLNKLLPFTTQNGSKNVDGFQGRGYMYFRETHTDIFLTLPAANKIYMMIKMSKEAGKVSPITTAEWEEKDEPLYVDLTMPNFTIENMIDLTIHLEESLPTLLKKEFQTTLTELPLFISVFLQKNKIVVNKEGLEAASATMLGLMAKCMPPKVQRTIIVDHAFSFLVSKGYGKNEATSGSKDFLHLFAGTVMDPTQG